MKIVYCINGTYNSGGMERVLANKANYLAGHGYDVTILTTDQRGQKPYFPLDPAIRCVDLDVNYEENNGASIINKIVNFPRKQRLHRKRLTDELNRIKPDITISMFCNDASFLYKIKDGSKKLLEIHFCKYKRLQYGRKGLWALADRLRSLQDSRIVARYDSFVTLTHEDKMLWGNLKNSTAIPNAQTFICDKPSSLDSKVVLAVGRYTYQKGFDLLLEAWTKVCEEVKDWTLKIVGDGEWHDKLAEQVTVLGIADRVNLCHATKDIIEEYRNASILVMSSRYEGFGMVLLEAQSAGLPTISFDCKCGPSEIIRDNVNGYLVPVGDVAMLADRLTDLIKDEDKRNRMGKQSYIDANNFSEDRIMSRWESLFADLCK